jgi:phosphoribosylamine--glycine ligase
MNRVGTPFSGVLYAGLMLTTTGPKVLEFNVRFGDPETQVILPRLKSDLVAIFEAVIDDRLAETEVVWDTAAAATVVLASGGYPESYPKGLPVSGLDQVTDGIVFHAGTRIRNGQLETSGGRVFNVTAQAATPEAALEQVYRNCDRIHFKGKVLRKDIGS